MELNQDIGNRLRLILGESDVRPVDKDWQHYAGDWTKPLFTRASYVVFPRSVEQVSAVVKLCNQMRQPIVPSGGRTGLAGGAIAQNGEVVLSLEKMARIIEINPIDPSITVEAGCVLANIHKAASDAGLFFPLDLGAKGSCQIGGNLATNAGGLRYIRYGGAREMLLGMEVVLADGSIEQLGTGLPKDNTGYDLKQLMCGSEGTLGIITRAILRLFPKESGEKQVALFALSDMDKVLECLMAFREARMRLSAFEYFSRAALDFVMRQKSAPQPFDALHDYYVLAEYEQMGDTSPDELLESLFTRGIVLDGKLAQSSAEVRQAWFYRESITESVAEFGHVYKNDIAVRVSALPKLLSGLHEIIASNPSKDLHLVTFGHIGDGNVHLNFVMRKSAASFDQFMELARPLETKVYELLDHLGGSISAEHGIGLLRKPYLHYAKSERQIALMRAIKREFDHNNILNPGKIFD